MVVEIVWSDLAKEDRKSIFTYWNNRNKSKKYSLKLNRVFNKHIELLFVQPKIGKPTDIEDVRVLIVLDYLIFYKFRSSIVSILRIIDSRREPETIFNSIKE